MKGVNAMSPSLSQFYVREDPRAGALIARYPGILAIPPSLDRVFAVPPRPGPDPGPELGR